MSNNMKWAVVGHEGDCYVIRLFVDDVPVYEYHGFLRPKTNEFRLYNWRILLRGAERYGMIKAVSIFEVKNLA